MYIYKRVEALLHVLTSALVGSECLVSCLATFRQGKNPSTYWTGGLEGPRAGLGDVARRKVLPSWESNPSLPAHCLVTIKIELIWHL